MRRKTERSATESFPGAIQRARIVALDERGRLFIKVAASDETIMAAVAATIDRPAAQAALDGGQDALVAFEDGDPTRPVVVALVRSEVGPQADPKHLVIQADLDGRRVRVVAKDEIVLEVGKASITLRRNGKVIVRGTHVETSSEGTNRIKGGQVKIN